MSQILSQEEVDALLSGISKGDVLTGTDEPVSANGVLVYDLTSQDRIIRGRMPTLEIINERFARIFRASLSTQLRKVVDIGSAPMDMIKFGEFLKALFVPTSLHIFRMDPIRGHALMVLESNLVFSLIDAFLGGKGIKNIKIEGRDFTNIENRMIRKVVDAALVDYEKAWNPVYPISVSFARSEVNPQFVGIVSASDLVVVTYFEVEMESSAGKLIICIPYGYLEPLRDTLQAGFQRDQMELDTTWMGRFKERLHEVPVNISVELGRTEILGRDLLGLEKGDVLVLDRYTTDELDIRAEGVSKFRGYPGVSKGNRAVQVSSVIGRGW